MNHSVLFNEILPGVTKPSRYLGTEYNTVHKDAATVDLRVALVLPDLYDLGLGNLGIHILYSILNELPWCWAERSYAPAPDMEAALRERGLKLFALESKDALDQMDMIGFSLQSELTYTNVLNILDLSGLPLRSRYRDESHPLIFAGGPTAVNPEPLAPFIDFFVIGDGEDIIIEITELVREMKDRSREELLEAIARIEGVYVPAVHPYETLPDGRVLPKHDAWEISRRYVKDFDGAHFPLRYIVPFTQLVHDRIGLEVLRGCTHGCRYCQAGVMGRPSRMRELGTVDRLMDDLLNNTGYDEVSLLSLSTCDYPRIRTLLEQSVVRARPDHVAVSVPSLRLDTFSVELADAVTGVRRSGLTFAPEAATPRLRSVINKFYDDEQLMDVATEAFRRGWTHIKCYFMIGLPTETDEDVEAIVDLCARVLSRGRTIDNRVKVFTGISTFVPKPFTPFQWAEQIGYEEIRRRQRILERGFAKHPGIKFGRHEPEATFIEGLIARGDQRMADVIEIAYRNGARLESCSELIDFQAWLDALDETGMDPAEIFAEKALDTRLPWDHIDVLIPRKWFQTEYQRALKSTTTPDCRVEGCQGCGLNHTTDGFCAQTTAKLRKASQEDRDRKCEPEFWSQEPEPPSVQRVRFRIGRTDEARFLSHLEYMNAWVRILRRARAPLSYSQGFHAHPKITFATAPPVGEESMADYMDVVLSERTDVTALLARVQANLPRGFQAFEATEVPLKAAALMSIVKGFDYMMTADADLETVRSRAEEILSEDALTASRKGRPSGRRKTADKREVDIRPMISALNVRPASNGLVDIEFGTRAVEGRLAKPKEVLEHLGLDPLRTRILKTATYLVELVESEVA